MNDQARWARVEELFDQAIDLPVEQRRNWVRETARGDAALEAEVVRMLDAHEMPGPLDGTIQPLAEADLRSRLEKVLAGRYLIGELLGSGGMSSVFLARELKHDRDIVIKVLQPGLAAAIGPSRFADEVRIAARLSHPHILALIDSGEGEGLQYFVMPYLGGTTLRARLAASGALPVSSAITLLRDIADALAHAHDAGVVHRDLKPENVLCVGEHAYLLDFGVAKLHRDLVSANVTGPGLAIGTPGYMAPEQASGGEVDHRADLYGWGLLAREMLSGRRDIAVPVGDRSDVPRDLMALIDSALEFEPARRPSRAGELVSRLDALIAPVAARRKRWPWVAAGVAALLLLAIWLRPEQRLELSALPQPIAVAPLLDETGDTTLAGIGRLAGDWITQGLHETTGLQVVAWPAARSASEAGGASSSGMVASLRDGTGARTVVTGSVYRLGDSLTFQAEVLDARSGTLVTAPAPVKVHRDSATAGVRLLRDRVLGAFAVSGDDRLAGSAFSTRPPTYAAYRRFDLALNDYNLYQYRSALEGMLETWRLDTSFTVVLVYGAYAAWNVGDRRLADSLVQEVMLRRHSMGEHHVALAQHIAAELQGDGVGALNAVRRATELASGSRSRYNLALSLARLNRPAEALAQLDSLDPDTGPMRGWPAYWSQRSYANHQLGNHQQELADAREMSLRHPAQRVTRVIEARALAASGRLAELDSLLRASEQLDPDVYWSQGAMREVAGEELLAHGDSGLARKYLEDAVAWFEARIRATPGYRAHQEWLYTAHYALGDWERAREINRRLLTIDGDRLLYRGQAAVLAARQGGFQRADSLLVTYHPSDRGEMLLYRARVAAIAGDVDQAVALLSQALGSGVDRWHWIHTLAWRDFATVRDDSRYLVLMAGTARQ